MLRTLTVLTVLTTASCRRAPIDAPALDLTGVGFATPESVMHDPIADVYLVSNINGAPLDADGNGFISRVLPDGTVDALKWIDGTSAGVALNGPKGMALLADTLFVADINVVRLFHRTTGAPLGERPVPGASFLNDMAVGPDGAVYVTDSGLDAAFAPTGTDALWQVVGGTVRIIAQGAALGGPNGITVTPNGIVVVSFGPGGIYRILPGNSEITPLPTPDQGGLDGVIVFADGSMLVSSWQASAVYRIGAGGTISVVVDSIPSPADIGWDATRSRVLIPVFQEDRVVIRHID